MSPSDYFKLLIALGPAQRAVLHEPETARYSRARTKLNYLLAHATPVGIRVPGGDSSTSVELACWARPSGGRGYGYFAIFRLSRSRGNVVFATLFCFYDGTEGSPGFRSLTAADAYAQATGFTKVLHDDIDPTD